MILKNKKQILGLCMKYERAKKDTKALGEWQDALWDDECLSLSILFDVAAWVAEDLGEQTLAARCLKNLDDLVG
jgi:hypothetical protein